MHRSRKTNNLWNRSVVGIGVTPDIVPVPGTIRDVQMLCWPIVWGEWGGNRQYRVAAAGWGAVNALPVPTLRGYCPGTPPLADLC
jgi:hypothetical protein